MNLQQYNLDFLVDESGSAEPYSSHIGERHPVIVAAFVFITSMVFVGVLTGSLIIASLISMLLLISWYFYHTTKDLIYLDDTLGRR